MSEPDPREYEFGAYLLDDRGRAADPLAESPERAEFRALLRSLVAQQSPPDRTRVIDDTSEFDRGLYGALAEIGVLGLDAPEELGGAGDLRDQLVAVEELGRGPTSMSAFLILQYAAIKFLGRNASTDEQRQVLADLVAGTTLVSFGMSERDGATDLGRALRTRAERNGSEWIVNGQKMWTSAATDARWIILFARTEIAEGSSIDGISSFLVRADAPGVEIRPLDTFGIHGMSTCEVFFDDVALPDDALVGTLGKGMRQAFATINHEGLLACAACLGVGHGALATARDYVAQREVFGKPIGAFQVPQHWLVDAAVGLEAARALMDRAAAIEVVGGRSEMLTLMAKLLASETAQDITLNGMQMMGGAGYLMEVPMQRFFRDVRLWSFSPLNNEMVRNRIGERLLQLPAFVLTNTTEESSMHDGPIGEIFVTCSLVPDVEHAVADASAALGFTFTPIQEAPLTLRTAVGLEAFNLRFAYSTGRAPYLEFVEEIPGSYFSSGGVTAYRHIGIWVDDLAAASDLVASRGYPLEAAGVEGDIEPFGFVHHRSAGGVRLELVDRARQPVLDAWLGGGSLDI